MKWIQCNESGVLFECSRDSATITWFLNETKVIDTADVYAESQEFPGSNDLTTSHLFILSNSTPVIKRSLKCCSSGVQTECTFPLEIHPDHICFGSQNNITSSIKFSTGKLCKHDINHYPILVAIILYGDHGCIMCAHVKN